MTAALLWQRGASRGCCGSLRWLRLRNHRLLSPSFSSCSCCRRKTFNIRDDLFEERPDNTSAPPLFPDLRDSPYRTFRAVMDERRAEAKRSLLVQVRSKASAEDLFIYANRVLGKVRGMHFHRNPDNTTFSNFYLLEFEKTESVSLAYERCHHRLDGSHQTSIPVYSPFLWLLGGSEVAKEPKEDDIPVYLPVHHNEACSDEEIMERTDRGSTLGSQMVNFYQSSEMTDISSRIRFLACEQIELSLHGMFPKAEALPFGSSVNSYGKNGSDLDMTVVLDTAAEVHSQSAPERSRLIFHAKGESTNGRSKILRYCDQLSSIILSFLPGCQNVQNIRQARVPIIKYQQQLLGLECDVTFGSLSGYYMSEILYLYGELDTRVRPLVFVVRKWAREHGLIEDARPTSYFTNFQLTMLVIFFLQAEYKMLPPYRDLVRLARKEDRVICEDGVDCSFLKDVSGIQHHLNTCLDDALPDLETLLREFFRFYEEFDFSRDAVCIVSGQKQPKRSERKFQRQVSYFLDLTNPLEPDLNVCSNVQQYSVNHFQSECRKSHALLSRMLELPQDEQRLSQVLTGKGPFKIQIKLSDLGWELKEEKTKIKNEKEQVSSETYHEKKKRRDELKKGGRPSVKVNRFFEPKF